MKKSKYKMPDIKNPVYKSMFKFIKKKEPYISDDDIKIGIYLFCEAHYVGEHSNLYQTMCEIDFKYDSFRDLEDNLDAMQVRWRMHNEW